jgi:hypothetical protein
MSSKVSIELKLSGKLLVVGFLIGTWSMFFIKLLILLAEVFETLIILSGASLIAFAILILNYCLSRYVLQNQPHSIFLDNF